jgi:hypothetical protein
MDQQLFRDLVISILTLVFAGYPIACYIQMQIENYKEKKAKKRKP